MHDLTARNITFVQDPLGKYPYMLSIYVYTIYVYIHHGPPKPTFLEVFRGFFMVNNWFLGGQNLSFSWFWGAHGIYKYMCLYSQLASNLPSAWSDMIHSHLNVFVHQELEDGISLVSL